MLQTRDTHPEFEALARTFLSRHPEIRHEWRPVQSAMWGGRTDLLCEPGSSREVFASLTSGQIVVGTSEARADFENFGRDLSSRQLADEAFGRFVALLKEKGVYTGERHDV